MWLLCLVLSTLAVAGSTLADEEGRVCPATLGEDEPMHKKLAEKALQCLLVKTSVVDRLQDMSPPEEVRVLVQELCEDRPQYHTCLDDVTLQSELCQNATRHQVFLILKDLLEITVEAGCKDNGTILASIFHELQSFSTELKRDGPLNNCAMKGAARLNYASKQFEFDASTKVFVLYREILSFKSCIRDYSKVDVSFRNSIDSFFTEITEKIKCINPEDKTTVLCKSIEGDGYCPITFNKDDTPPKDKGILHRLEKCLKDIHTEDGGFEDIHDLLGYLTFYKQFCNKKRDIGKCVNHALVLSELCLDSNERELFNAATDLVSGAVESGCVDEGKPLAVVTHNFLRTDNGTEGHPNPTKECLLAAKSALSLIQQEDVHTFTRALHRELGTFKHCLLGQLRGDNRAVFLAEVMFNRMLRKMWCVDSESNATVSCEALQPTPAPLHCPFVTDDQSAYPTFTDLAFSCLKLNTLALSYIDELSTLDECGHFFRLYCDDKTPVINCLKDVEANSKVCTPALEHHMVHILIDLTVNTLESGCEGKGAMLASTVYAMVKYKDALKPCKAAAAERFKKIATDEGNTTAVTLGTFTTMIDFTECYSNNVPEEGRFKADSLFFLRLVIKRLECVNNDGSVVLCETIVNDVHAD